MANEKWLINAWDLIEWLQNIDLENHLRHLRGKKSKWLDTEGVRHMIATVPTVDAVEASRLGDLGRLMMPYNGCPRGRMGARGDGRIIELDPIKDVEGDIWVPVLEEDLNFLKAKAVEVVRCKDGKHYWKNVNTPGFDGKCTTVGDDDFCSDGERKDNDDGNSQRNDL